MSALNPDRATLNFLNSFPAEVRKKGDKLQQDAAVTQIFGNHLFIQGKVVDENDTFRVTLRLQGNRWFGNCTAENEADAGSAMYATMMERMYRGEDLPESPNEFDDTPILDVIEDKLDRELDDKEADFVSKLEKRYRRYVIEGEIHDHDLVRLNTRWDITSYDPLELWPIPPGDIIEFWNYIAYAFYKKKLPYPEFLEVITDLAAVQKQMSDWEDEREVAAWYETLESVNERPPIVKPLSIQFRMMATMNEAKMQAREEEREWYHVTEKGDIERLQGLYAESALRMDSASQVIWENFIDFYKTEGTTLLDLDEQKCCSYMNRLFKQEALAGSIVNLDEKEYSVVNRPLKWVCDDDEGDPSNFSLQLVTKEGEFVSHSVRQLPGREELYQSDQTVFPGPPRWVKDSEIMPRYQIPKAVIESLEGVEFLRKIGARLPASLKKRVVDLELYPQFKSAAFTLCP